MLDSVLLEFNLDRMEGSGVVQAVILHGIRPMVALAAEGPTILYRIKMVLNSVPDPDPNPDPPDPHVSGPPGPGSGSISQRYGSGSNIKQKY
jgi:hypothetical protein